MTSPSPLDRVWTVPNLLSAARLLLSMVLFVAIVQQWHAAAL